MKDLRWNLLKSDRLKRTRGASFEDLMQGGTLLAVKRHPARTHQQIMLFLFKGYVWIVPYVETEREVFLKTLYPSRKYTKLHRRGEV
jgi:hypothetical protein